MTSENTATDVLTAIYERRSVRHFQEAPVARDVVMEALEAAIWAPSGLNNQPWRFAVVWDAAVKEEIGSLTRYATIVKSAGVLIPVFLDRETSYDYVKDCQAVGAAIQNMLLTLHARGLGAVWLGEILKNKDRVRDLLELPERLELMAVVAVGHPAHRNQSSHRRPVEEVLVLER
jgi:nitroreductase